MNKEERKAHIADNYKSYSSALIGVAMECGLDKDSAQDIAHDSMLYFIESADDDKATPEIARALMMQKAEWLSNDHLDKRKNEVELQLHYDPVDLEDMGSEDESDGVDELYGAITWESPEDLAVAEGLLRAVEKSITKELGPRAWRMFAMAAEGEAQAEIARLYEVSQARVSQVLEDCRSIAKRIVDE